MTRTAVLFTVIFLLFTFSYARFITVEPEHDVTTKETDPDLTESDPKTTTSIRLPGEGPGFEPAKVVDFKHVDGDASKTELDVDSIPLTTIRFHPVNRHFPRRPLIPFRHKHDCRFHNRFRPLNPRFQQKRYISYGNDMILSDERPRFDPESSGVVRQIQARWARFPDDLKEHVDFMKLHDHEHEHDHDHDHENEHDVDDIMPQDHDPEHDHHHDHDDDHHHHHHHHRRRHHHHGEEGEWDEEDEHGHEHEGGFMKRLSKFFINF